MDQLPYLILKKHPEVKICNEDEKINNYEIQFWTNAVEAINEIIKFNRST